MFCSKCGKVLPDNAQFCSGCGSRTVNNADSGYVNIPYTAPGQLDERQKKAAQLANLESKKQLEKSLEKAEERKTSSILLGVILGGTAAIISLVSFVNLSQTGFDIDSVNTMIVGFISGAVALGAILGTCISCSMHNRIIEPIKQELDKFRGMNSQEKLLFEDNEDNSDMNSNNRQNLLR